MKKKVAKHPDGKTVETVEHEDGRKAVTINVNTLSIDETDEESLQAKKIIEERILPQIGQHYVNVTLVHKPSNQHVDARLKKYEARAFAEQAVDQFKKLVVEQPLLAKYRDRTREEDFVLVIFDGDSIEVSSL